MGSRLIKEYFGSLFWMVNDAYLFFNDDAFLFYFNDVFNLMMCLI
ncbi:hypothetical protein HpNP133_13120 [Helicobacter pylori]